MDRKKEGRLSRSSPSYGTLPKTIKRNKKKKKKKKKKKVLYQSLFVYFEDAKNI